MDKNPTSMRVQDPGIRDLFTLDAQWQAWLDVEAALALAEAEIDVVPQAAAKEIVAKAKLELLDRSKIDEGLRRTAHPLVPLVWELARVCDGDAGNYVHWGATTQNITQTGNLLQLRRAHGIFLDQFATILSAMAALAERTHDMALPGRTHGQHAVPATFGLKVAVWIDETARHVERLQGAEGRVFAAMLGGGAGTMASFDGQGPEIQRRMAAHLRMTPMAVPARTIGDHLAEYVTLLGLIAGTCSKIAREVYTLMKEEFKEVEEPVPAGTVGSSTMPQKRNPKLSQDIMASAAHVRALVPLALEAMETEHEADRGRDLMMNQALHTACGETGDILERIRMLMEGIQVFPDRMRRNLDLSGGLIMAEALMLSLGAHIGRQEAHDVIYDTAQDTATGDKSFKEHLAANAMVKKHLTPEQVEALLDPTDYTGMSSHMALEQAARGAALAADLRARPKGR
ncbi:MAG: adenylosuccinate lyase family protein [Alphaproteobacteria bacterium]|nr:adenylosuccinate lyase family protein [Alphaproteobacteria bacterium]